MGTHQIEKEIEIAADAERVWAILTDFDAYSEWNPFIRSIRGQPREAARLTVRIQPSGASGMTFRPAVLVARPEKELRWLGHLLVPGLFDGEHRFEIEPLGSGRVLFRQSERFTGVLVSLLRRSLDHGTLRGFDEMNRALKARAEAAGA